MKYYEVYYKSQISNKWKQDQIHTSLKQARRYCKIIKNVTTKIYVWERTGEVY